VLAYIVCSLDVIKYRPFLVKFPCLKMLFGSEKIVPPGKAKVELNQFGAKLLAKMLYVSFFGKLHY
jgi:hypothetical protein